MMVMQVFGQPAVCIRMPHSKDLLELGKQCVVHNPRDVLRLGHAEPARQHKAAHAQCKNVVKCCGLLWYDKRELVRVT